jgi:hypothetical protein
MSGELKQITSEPPGFSRGEVQVMEFMSAVADRIEKTRWGFSDEVDAESAFDRAKEAVVEAIRDEIEEQRRKDKQCAE